MKRVLRLILVTILMIPIGAARAEKGLSFTWHNLAMTALKLKIGSGMVHLASIPGKELVAFSMPDFFEKYRDNEFKMGSMEPVVRKKMRAALASWPQTPIIIIRTEAHFGDYDFHSQRFAFHPFSPNSYIWPIMSDYAGQTAPQWPTNSYWLYFTNTGLVNGLPMPKQKAQAFLDAKTDSTEQIDRSVSVHLTVAIIGLAKASMADSGATALEGKIVDARVYSDKSETHLLHEYKAN